MLLNLAALGSRQAIRDDDLAGWFEEREARPVDDFPDFVRIQARHPVDGPAT